MVFPATTLDKELVTGKELFLAERSVDPYYKVNH